MTWRDESFKIPQKVRRISRDHARLRDTRLHEIAKQSLALTTCITGDLLMGVARLQESPYAFLEDVPFLVDFFHPGNSLRAVFTPFRITLLFVLCLFFVFLFSCCVHASSLLCFFSHVVCACVFSSLFFLSLMVAHLCVYVFACVCRFWSISLHLLSSLRAISFIPHHSFSLLLLLLPFGFSHSPFFSSHLFSSIILNNMMASSLSAICV